MRRGSGGPLADCGAAACRAPSGGSPTGAAPHAGQLARTRKQVAEAVTLTPMTAPLRNLTGASSAPDILSPSKDHSQGRTSSLRCGRSTLTVIFPGKTSAPIRRTGEDWMIDGTFDGALSARPPARLRTR
jgi:hypothetical protein